MLHRDALGQLELQVPALDSGCMQSTGSEKALLSLTNRIGGRGGDGGIAAQRRLLGLGRQSQ
jgi:hypothetical protein